ncbi:MAG TPA: quinone-dependent dihydroorotate dehydrogenase, partial [Candidatus Paceibacterota bacterium]|nr:quinone-dependent dihydroorotate dehydrogenase [Candidatus Paceibacterota bacterium]
STAVLKKVRQLAGPDYPLIGVGGIFTRRDADEKFDAGANLIQIYTSFIYEGPRVVRALR